MSLLRSALLALLLMSAPALAAPSPAEQVNDLIAADRAFSVSAEQATDPVSGLAPMLDADAVMPLPGRGNIVGRDAVIAALRASPSLSEGKVSWTPIRGGVSADGTHGFTFGFLTASTGPPDRRERKYLAYWIRRPGGWRVAAYRQLVRPAGEVSLEPLAPSLPAFTAEPTADPAAIAAHQRSLAAVEKAFSDRAQSVGLRAAFGEFGCEDAMHMSQGKGFSIGLAAITAGFPAERAANIHWGTERSFVASSGDLGVSIGTIHRNGAKAGEAGLPFFTIWRRDGPTQPWRYVAE